MGSQFSFSESFINGGREGKESLFDSSGYAITENLCTISTVGNCDKYILLGSEAKQQYTNLSGFDVKSNLRHIGPCFPNFHSSAD